MKNPNLQGGNLMAHSVEFLGDIVSGSKFSQDKASWNYHVLFDFGCFDKREHNSNLPAATFDYSSDKILKHYRVVDRESVLDGLIMLTHDSKLG